MAPVRPVDGLDADERALLVELLADAEDATRYAADIGPPGPPRRDLRAKANRIGKLRTRIDR